MQSQYVYLQCPSCKSTNVKETIHYRTFKFWFIKIRSPHLLQRLCNNCNFWNHVLVNGKSPSHIKRWFQAWKIQTERLPRLELLVKRLYRKEKYQESKIGGSNGNK